MNVPSAKETTAIPFVIFNALEPQPRKEEIMIELYELAATDDKQSSVPTAGEFAWLCITRDCCSRVFPGV